MRFTQRTVDVSGQKVVLKRSVVIEEVVATEAVVRLELKHLVVKQLVADVADVLVVDNAVRDVVAGTVRQLVGHARVHELATLPLRAALAGLLDHVGVRAHGGVRHLQMGRAQRRTAGVSVHTPAALLTLNLPNLTVGYDFPVHDA